MSIYEANMSALQKKNAILSEALLNLDTNLHYEIYMDGENTDSLNLIHNQSFKPLYDTKPHEIIQNQLAAFKVFQEYPYLYFFGIGNGGFLKYLLANSKHQRIMVMEPDYEILYIVLNIVDFSIEIEEERLVILGADQVDFPTIASFFKYMEIQRYMKLYDLHIMSPYYETFSKSIQNVNKIFVETLYHMAMIPGNDTTDALIGLKHHITNLPEIVETSPLHGLFNQLNKTNVAVLVSTGPSLAKQLPLLKKIANHVTIVAVDASFPVLVQYGIQPDVVTSIERVPLTSRFFNSVPKKDFDGVTFVLSSVQHSDVINSIKGGEKIISLRPLGYMMITGPKEWGHVGIGMSSANMAYEIIYHSKFKSCILIGQDLAYGEDGSSHSDGHVFGAKEVKQKESDGWAERYGGGGKVRTTMVWNMFRSFFEKDIVEAQTRMATINATEGGARIYGAIELPFEEAVAKYVNPKIDKTPLLLKKLEDQNRLSVKSAVNTSVENIKIYTAQFKQDVEKLFLEAAHICDQMDMGIQIDFNTLKSVMDKINMIRQRMQEEIFDKVIWHIAQTMMFMQEITLAPIEVRYTESEEQEYQQLVDLLQVYKGWLFSLAGSMDAILKTIEYAQGRSLLYDVRSIDVILNGEKIDQIDCKDMKAVEGRVFDVDMRGILYDVPDAYQEQIDDVVFMDAKSSQVLPKAFVNVFRRDDAKYNELSFMKSLEKPSCDTLIVGNYTSNTIGFLATKENLEDEAFMDYISELQNYFKDTKIIAYIVQNTSADELKAFEKLVVQNVLQLEHTQVLILNQKNELDRLVLYKANWNNIFLLSFTGLDMQKSLKELYVEGMVDLYRKHSDVFELTVEDVERLNNHILIGTVISLKNVDEEEGLEQLFDVDKTPQERSYKLIDLAFKNQTFIQNIVEFRIKLHKMVL